MNNVYLDGRTLVYRRVLAIALVAGLGWLGLLGAGCEHDSVPDYGNVRVDNDWSQDVQLFINGELRKTISPGKRQSAAVDEGLLRVSIRDAGGNELFGQNVDIPDNTFAEYIVLENGQVVATAGNIRRPDIVGGDDEQVRVENFAGYPVTFHVNGGLLATIAPQADAILRVPGGIFITITFRRNGGTVLFEQTLQVPRNTVIHYSVLPDGAVVATGGPIEPNTDIEDSDSYDSFFD